MYLILQKEILDIGSDIGLIFQNQERYHLCRIDSLKIV